MVVYYAPPTFPFTRLFPQGIVLVILGVIGLALGVVDLIYNQIKFDKDICKDDDYSTTWQCPNSPCGNPSLPWILTGSGIWSGFFVMFAGGLATSLMYSTDESLKVKRDSTGVMAGLVTFPLGPMTLVINVLRLFYSHEYIYCVDPTSEDLLIADFVPFLMPIIISITLFVAWCICLAVLVSICRRGHLTTREEIEYEYGRRHNGYDEYSSSQPRQAQRPFVVSDTYDYRPTSYTYTERPTYGFWRDRTLAGWRDQGGVYPTTSRPYSLSRSDPYLASSKPRRSRGYYTMKSYNRY